MTLTVHALVFDTCPSDAAILLQGRKQLEHASDSNSWITFELEGVPDVEAFSVQGLEEFCGTNLDHIANFDGLQFSVPKSLHDLIPQPHYHPIPSVIVPHPARLLTVPPHPVISYLSETAHFALTVPFARMAWIIPISGAPPFSEATPAIYLNSIPSQFVRQTITWTSECLLDFWGFLLKAQKDNSFGPLGLSFSCAHYDGEFDHIKVYHDAAHTMRIRALLHTIGPDCQQEAKRRVLKDARLTLVDDCGKGLLIS